GSNETVDLSSLVGTDDQTAAEVTIADAGGNFTATEVEGALAELAAGSTDDQNISGSGLSGTDLTIGIEGGSNETVDLSSLVGTDDQNISGSGLSGTDLTIGIEGGSNETVDLSSLVGTDDQNISGSGLSGTDLTIGIEGGSNETVDLSSLVGTDDQNISGSGLSGTDLTIGIEGGSNQVIDLSSLDDSGTDDQLDSEVDLATDIDVDEGGVVSPTLETTVQEVIQAIAPITSKAARIFYPPSITVDASTTGIKSIDLYQEYLDQFGTPTAASAGAPTAVPTYGRTELYYYVTYADPTVFETDPPDPNFMTIDANGNLTIEVENVPTDYNTLINVVFVVK
ncbi:MAG: hypothetical protein ABJN95_06475, partial [Maribacter sp.]|uniref:hypothetical protein n=1 Tax=Maribacter sp. TaxID=1897614 RepID=UPI003299319C